MKNSKLLKYFVASVLALALIVGAVTAVLAFTDQADVIFHYDGNNSYFRFSDGVVEKNIYEDTTTVSVFRLENVMPGDSFNRTLNVKCENINGKNVIVNLYLTVELPTEGAAETVSTVRVPEGYTYDVNHKLLALLDASYNGRKLSEPQDKIFIGQYSSDSVKKSIDIKFELPLSAGNEYQNLYSAVDWVFIAEVIDNPQTEWEQKPEFNVDDHFAYIIGAPDGLVRPLANITRAEVATILFRCMSDRSREYFWSTENPYSDVSADKWYNNAISTLTNAGVIKGTPGGSFLPETPITRAEYATMLSRFYVIQHSDTVSFSDVTGHWAEEAIISGAANGYILGDPDGRFRPDEPILRAEAFALTNRVLQRKPHKDHFMEDMIKWPDNADTTRWYYADVQEATNSHTAEMFTDYEEWTKLVPHKDWVALEKEWSVANDENKQTFVSKPF